MAATITFRLDEDTRLALDGLTADGTHVSGPYARLLSRPQHGTREGRRRAEAAALTEDPTDRAEATQVLRDMESSRAG